MKLLKTCIIWIMIKNVNQVDQNQSRNQSQSPNPNQKQKENLVVNIENQIIII